MNDFQYICAEEQDVAKARSVDCAPLFRKKFNLSKVSSARLRVQMLGLTEMYLNGNRVTEDLFISATSDYTKLRWYHEYDVTALLQEGENVFAVICGNGFYNEKLKTPWDYDVAPWRDIPKLSLKLTVGDDFTLYTDESWKCNLQSFIVFNQFRTGEHFDARKFDARWIELNFDDASWGNARIASDVFNGRYLLCECEPIREKEVYSPVKIIPNDLGYVVDFGVNMSGYISLQTRQTEGTLLTLTYGEEMTDDFHIKMLDDTSYYYPDGEYQTDKMICSGNLDYFKPKFTYHGFRYLQIAGCELPIKKEDLRAYFVHQDIRQTSTFHSSNEILNFIYRAGIRSTYSNMFYIMTDCPSREKLGWCNDAQATMEQALIDFDSAKFYEKWFEDLKSSMNEQGGLPAIIPSSGWGFDWGPVCDYLLYEMPYRVYEYCGNAEMLKESLPYLKRYLAYMNEKIEENYQFILADWTGYGNSTLIPTEFIILLYRIKMLRTIAFTERLSRGHEEEKTRADLRRFEEEFKQRYLKDGRCVLNEQTALAMLVCHGLYDNKEAVQNQLIEKVEQDGFRLQCGMVGVQYLYYALVECGKADYAVKIITESEPGYKTWYENGATTLWEKWDGVNTCSHNHQMFSGVIAWFFKALLGLVPDINYPAYERIMLKPNFATQLQFCEGSIQAKNGTVFARWERKDGKIYYDVTIPEGISAQFRGEELSVGLNEFVVDE